MNVDGQNAIDPHVLGNRLLPRFKTKFYRNRKGIYSFSGIHWQWHLPTIPKSEVEARKLEPVDFVHFKIDC